MAATCREAGSKFVTGDTKVVGTCKRRRVHHDLGVGVVPAGRALSTLGCARVTRSCIGPIGDHGVAILSACVKALISRLSWSVTAPRSSADPGPFSRSASTSAACRSDARRAVPEYCRHGAALRGRRAHRRSAGPRAREVRAALICSADRCTSLARAAWWRPSRRRCRPLAGHAARSSTRPGRAHHWPRAGEHPKRCACARASAESVSCHALGEQLPRIC